MHQREFTVTAVHGNHYPALADQLRPDPRANRVNRMT